MDQDYPSSLGPDELMQTSAHLLQTVLDTIHMGVCVLRPLYKKKKIIDFEYLLVNEEAKRYTGDIELEGRSFLDVKDDPALLETLANVIKTGSEDGYTELLTISDKKHFFSVRCIKFNSGVMLTYQDITQQVTIRDRIKQNELKWQTLVENTPDPVARLDRDLRYVFVNKAFLTAAGRKAEEVIGKTNVEIGTPKEQAEPWISYVRKVFATGEPGEFVINYTRNDRKSCVTVKVVPEPDEEGNILSVLAISRDITKMKDAENELAQKTNDKYLSIFNSIDEGFHLVELICDESDRVVDIMILEENPAAKAIFGKSLAGKTIKHAYPEFDNDRFQIWGKVARTGINHRITRYSEVLKKWIDIRLTRAGSENNSQVVSIFHDVTDIKRTENELKKNQLAMAVDLADAKQLQAISSQLIHEDKVEAIYEQLLNAAVSITHAEMATMQIFVAEKDALLLLSSKGVDPKFADIWQWVKRGDQTTCGTALERNKRIIMPDVETSDLVRSPESRANHRLAGVRAAQSTPLITRSGQLIGMISTLWSAVHEPAERELYLLDVLARQAADLLERRQKEDALRKSQERLAADLADTRQLQLLSSRLIQEDNIEAIYEEILAAATGIMHAKMGCMQVLVSEKDQLLLLAHKGFDPKYAAFWQWIKKGSQTSCGMSLERKQRTIVPDIETCGFMKGTEFPEAYRALGVRALQSTPLITRSGHIVGMISTHWHEVHEPSERELYLLDVLARQAADLLERKQREEKYLSHLQKEVNERTDELKQSKELLQNIAETIPDMISVQEYPSREVIYFNRNPYSFSGLSADELAKMPIEERHKLVHPDDIDGMRKYAESMAHISDADIAAFEYRVKNKQNGWIWLRTRSKVFERDEKGNVISFINTIQDITPYKEANEKTVKSLALLQQSEEIAGTGTWEYDIRTKEFICSDGMYGLLGIERGKAITPGMYLDYAIEEDRDKAQQLVNHIQDRFSPMEITLRLKLAGLVKTIKIKTIPLKNDRGQVEKMLGVDMDITRQVKTSEQIIDLNVELVERSKDLGTLNTELRSFNTIAAKDYKETIQTLYTNMEYIANNEARRLSGPAKANIRKAQAAIQRMKLLTDDINHYLTLNDVEIERTMTNPNPLLQNVIAQMNEKIERSNALIESMSLPVLALDPQLFMHLMSHLLDNAIKFRDPEITPVIKVTHSHADQLYGYKTPKNTAYTIISVSDNGIGVAKKDLETIFELFYTVHDKGKYKGSGIGLAICKKIMRMHNGFITAKANASEGTTIHCYFPTVK